VISSAGDGAAGADSLETIKQTHLSYFNGKGQQLEELPPD
jgi:hypothetical protein